MNRFMREGSIQQNQLLLGLDNLWNESVLLLKVIKHSCWEVFFLLIVGLFCLEYSIRKYSSSFSVFVCFLTVFFKKHFFMFVF